MKITVLGSGTAIPDKERGAPGIAVELEGVLLFLDLGAGSLYRAARFGVPVDLVDFVLLTHLHLDHTGDLTSLLFALRNPEYPRAKDLSVYGPLGLKAFLERLGPAYGEWIEPRGYSRTVEDLESSTVSFDSWRLRSCPVKHGPPAIAFEITDGRGKRLVYSGDTEYCEGLVEFATAADLLILECSFPDGQGCPGHLTPAEAGRIAGEARCEHLLLTHFYPACRGQDLLTSLRNVYDGPVTLAWDGLTMET